MKISFLSTAFIFITLFLLGTIAFGQNNMRASSNKDIDYPILHEETQSERTVNFIEASVLKSFEKKFPGIRAKWTTVNDHLIARFNQEIKTVQAVFSQDGKLIYALYKSEGKNLPADMKQMLEQEYLPFKVETVSEMVFGGNSYKTINLKKGDQTLILQLINDTIVNTQYLSSK